MGCGFCVVVPAADEAAALELLRAHYPGAARDRPRRRRARAQRIRRSVAMRGIVEARVRRLPDRAGEGADRAQPALGGEAPELGAGRRAGALAEDFGLAGGDAAEAGDGVERRQRARVDLGRARRPAPPRGRPRAAASPRRRGARRRAPTKTTEGKESRSRPSVWLSLPAARASSGIVAHLLDVGAEGLERGVRGERDLEAGDVEPGRLGLGQQRRRVVELAAARRSALRAAAAGSGRPASQPCSLAASTAMQAG